MPWDRMLEGLAKIGSEASKGEWAVLGILIGAVVVLALYLFREKGSPWWLRLIVFAIAVAVPFGAWAYLLATPSSLISRLDNTTWTCVGACAPNPSTTPRIRVVVMQTNESGQTVEGRIEGSRTITHGALRGTLSDDLRTIIWDNNTKWIR